MSTIEISMILDQVKTYHEEQEMVCPPPPYKTMHGQENEEVLPTYNDLTNELEQIMNNIPSRLEDQRGIHMTSSKIQKRRNSSTSHTISSSSHINNNNNNRRSSIQLSQLLDKMEKYRHQDQEFSTDNKLMMNQLMKNMYTIQSTSSKSSKNNKSSSSITFSSLKNLKYPFFTKKMKSRRLSSSPNPASSSKDEFDLFLNTIYVSTKQSQLLDQRAMIMIA
ncbi:unnamed protein product [Cunninghamella blakesleeana]